MVHIPKQCARCGYRFQDNTINVSNSRNITLRNVGGGACPRCGGPTRFLEGTFNVIDERIEMLSGPVWSYELADTLRRTLEQIVAEKPADPIAPIEKVAPPLARDIRAAAERQGMSTVQIIELVSAILGILVVVNDSFRNADPNQLWTLMLQIARLLSELRNS